MRSRPNTHGHRPPSNCPFSTITNHSDPINQRLRQIGLRPRTVKIEASLCDQEIDRVLDTWQRDASDEIVGVGALFYRLANGITPPDLEHLEENMRINKYLPQEYRHVITGYQEEVPA